MAEFTKVLTEKGKDCVVFNSYRFREFGVSKAGNKSWKCCQINCTSTIIIDGTVMKIISGFDVTHEQKI